MPSVKLKFRDVTFWIDYRIIDNQPEDLYIYVEGDKNGADLYDFLDSSIIEKAEEAARLDLADLQAYQAEYVREREKDKEAEKWLYM